MMQYDAIDPIFDGNQPDPSGRSSDEEQNNEIEDQYKTTFPLTKQPMLQKLAMTFPLPP